MDWFGFWLDGLLLTAMGILQLLFLGGFTGAKPKIRHFVFYLLLLSVIEIAADASQFYRLAVGVQLILLYLISRLALKNSRAVSGAAAILTLHISQISFGIINPIEALLFADAIGQTRLYLLVVLASLSALAICVACYQLILTRFSLVEGHHEPYLWLLIPPALFFFAIELFLLDAAYGSVVFVPAPFEAAEQITLLAMQLLGLGALFSTLYAYRRASISVLAQDALASLTQAANAQSVYVAQAQMRYEKTQAFRHDMKNHLLVLGGLLKQGNTEQAQEYLRLLDAVTGELSFPVHTNNAVIDILLGDKCELAKAAGIDVEVTLALPQTCNRVDDVDLCILFANAMDNAIEACRQRDGSKTIRVTGEQQGDFYMLEFENTCADGSPMKMGTGLNNVKNVAEKYGGAIMIEKASSRFRLNVLLNIS